MNKVLIVGHDGGWNLEASYARAFRRQSSEVFFWDSGRALALAARGRQFGRLVSRLVDVEPWKRKANLELIELTSRLRPDLMLVISTEGLRAGTIGQIRALLPRMPIYCLFPDTPHNLTPERIQCLPMFDRVITVSPFWIDCFHRLGARCVSYLPLAADTELHHPMADHISPEKKLAFIGNWRPERETILAELAEHDLEIWGSYYWRRRTNSDSVVRQHWMGREAVGNEFAAVCASHKILLNLIDSVGWPGPNMRAFEHAACAGFSLTTRTPALLDVFTEGDNIECFESVEEAKDKIRFYLQNETARRRIAAASYDKVVHGGHAYGDRVKQLMKWAVDHRPMHSRIEG